ncbi:MAG: ATPase-like protein [Chloroflexi bacterium]|nr:ATPase-like protein [Chloroflexota bacterium]
MCAYSGAIRTPDQRLRVFISSTMGELAAERATAKEAVEQLRLTPVLFEAGARAHPPRDLYRAYLAQSDIFLGIYWQRYGQVAPGMDVSGLEDEYRLSENRPRLIYVKMPAPQREPRLQAMIDHLREPDASSYRHFATPLELRGLVADDLALLLTERFAGAPQTRTPERSAQLPVQRGVLFGRAREVDTTSELLLREDVGLVTVTGPGGVGKTRLAVQVAADLAPRFADGVAFVPLDTLTDPSRLRATIAQALRIPETAGQPLGEALLEYLRARQMLLLLDNVEQLISAAPLATRALEAAPRLKILTTSREPLRVHDERVVPIPPLTLPVPGAPQSLKALARIPSVALFVERTRELQPTFELTDENAAAVAEICRRLDGLPLALELAAARLAMLSPQALLAHLGQRLPLLTHGQRDLPARQRTLRDTIAWSYELLDEREKGLFRGVSVFVGGFTLEAVEAVCFGDDSEQSSSGVADRETIALEGLASLVDQSLVYRAEGVAGDPRFAMLETIREFAVDQAAAAGEVAALRRRHAAYFLSLAEAAAPHYVRPDRGWWIERLHSEDANLRAALTWGAADDMGATAPPPSAPVPSVTAEALAERAAGRSTGSGGAERGYTGPRLASALAGALAWYWLYRGQIQEGREWLETLLARSEPDDRSMTRGAAQYSAGLLAWAQGDLAAADRWAEAALATATARGDGSQLPYAHSLLGLVRTSQGDIKAARPLLEEGRNALHSAGQIWEEAYALYYLVGVTAMDGDVAAAQKLAEECLTLFTQAGDILGRALAYDALGVVATVRGDHATAVARFAEGTPLMRATGRSLFLAQFLGDAGRAWLEQGDELQAERLLTESLDLWRDIGRADGAAIVLVGLAEIAAARKQPRHGALLLGAAQALRSASGAAFPSYLKSFAERAAAASRAALGVDAFDAARKEGAALSLDKAVAEAREVSTADGKGEGEHA